MKIGHFPPRLARATASLIIAASLLAGVTPAMAQTKISALGGAAAPTGAELVPCVQSGVTKSCSITQIGATTLGAPLDTALSSRGISGTAISTNASNISTLSGTVTGLQTSKLNSDLTTLSAASTLAGGEVTPVTQSGATKAATTSQYSDYTLKTGLPALTAAAQTNGAETVPMVQNGSTVLGSIAYSIAPNARATFYNLTPGKLPKWRAAIARVIAGTGNARLLFDGDSTTMGLGAGTGGTGNVNGAASVSITAFMKKFMGALPASDQVVLGDKGVNSGSTVTTTPLYDPRLSFVGSSWSNSVSTMGGRFFSATTGTDNFTFTPASTVDNCKVYYTTGSGNGTFNFGDTTTPALATVNTNAAAGFASTTITRAGGLTGGVSVARTGVGAGIYIYGFECWNSATPSVVLMNGGFSGTTAVTQAVATNPWDSANVVASLAPDLTLINLGINDVRQNVTTANTTTALQTIITKAKASGDVVLVFHHPDSAPVNAALVAPLRAAYISLAISNDVPMIDLTDRLVSTTASAALYYDSVHLNAPGYADEARGVAEGILR